ncbi:hypothetical protein [Saccharothrix sp. HUAS TT1]|uniref:hypothetical protein n=1 Tax=unclassified Saccharothrix TaxID=2593673 RepID=UPI00345C1471
MGEWQKLVPRPGTSQGVGTAVGGVVALVFLQVLVWTGHGTWGMVPLSLFFVVFTAAWWRIGWTGVYVGPRGVKIHHPFKRVEVVPWDEVVGFEARPVRLPTSAVEGAVLCLVGARVHPTPVKLSRGRRFDWAAYLTGYDVVLPEEAFTAAVATLDKAVRTRPR